MEDRIETRNLDINELGNNEEISDVDNDIRYALRIQANDDGIFDEENIERLTQEYIENGCSYNEIINESFTEYSINVSDVIPAPLNVAYTLIHQNLFEPVNSFNNIILNFQYDARFRGIQNPLLNILNVIGNVANMEERVPLILTQNALNQLQEITYENLPQLNADEKCPICFVDIQERQENNEKYILLKCNHIFHSNCIKTYLSQYDYHCPVCRDECGEHEAKI